jgi:FKBP-type peptidyl-prolyl cis-trans isomerase
MRKPVFALLLVSACTGSAAKDESAVTTTPPPKAAPAAQPALPNAIPAPADVGAVPADAEKSASGLAWKILTPGTGDQKPAAEDTVEVHYTGWTLDGRMFDKLLKITPAPKPIPAPPDVAAAPRDAKKTASGLAYKVLQKGTGKRHPKDTDQVEVHYSGWTTDGHMFDSSVMRGKTAVFPLNRVIKGWTEGVQLMVEGEKTRFWIPGGLAYGDTPSRPGAPAGMLCFDVELVHIR